MIALKKKKRKTYTNAYGKAINFHVCASCKSSVHHQTFWITTITFWLCFFVWFGNVHLTSWIKEEIQLTSQEISINKSLLTISTIISRIFIGDLCDKIGPRYCYLLILMISLVPVCLLSVIETNIQFMISNFLLGLIGSSFVITQYHTTQFFTDRLIGIVNATSAGWGNFGGGCAAFLLPFIASHYAVNWRYLTIASGLLLLIPMFLYYYLGTDTVNGNVRYHQVLTRDNLFDMRGIKGAFKDYRTWILFLVYMECFGVEITVLTFMQNYLMDQFNLNVTNAGLVIFMFSSLNLFARSAGGYGSDILYRKYGIQAGVSLLFLVLLSESIFLTIFSFGTFNLGYSIVIMLLFSFYVQCAEGITYAIVPFIALGSKNKRIGSYYGIVAAGGNFGSFLFSFIFHFTPNGSNQISYQYGFITLAIFVFISSFLTLKIKFTAKERRAANEILNSFLKHHRHRIYGKETERDRSAAVQIQPTLQSTSINNTMSFNTTTTSSLH